MPQQPRKQMMMMKPYKKMGVITDNERKMLEKIDYAGDFDKEIAKYEKPRRQQAREMMRTSNPEVRETKKDMIRRKKKEFGIVGQLTDSELKMMKRSMSAKERKMLSDK